MSKLSHVRHKPWVLCLRIWVDIRTTFIHYCPCIGITIAPLFLTLQNFLIGKISSLILQWTSSQRDFSVASNTNWVFLQGSWIFTACYRISTSTPLTFISFYSIFHFVSLDHCALPVFPEQVLVSINPWNKLTVSHSLWVTLLKSMNSSPLVALHF